MARDDRSQELALPWCLAATVIAQRLPDARSVLDCGSGPGSFLGFALEALPGAHGTWLDLSEEMREQAKENLAAFGARTTFVIEDLLGLDRVGQPGSFDAVLSSRAVHHLGTPGLGRFYTQVAGRLRPGGWMANLDLFRVAPPWDAWLMEALGAIRGPSPTAGTHPHEYPLPLFEDHIVAIQAAGLEAAHVPWRSFTTALFLARKPAGD